MKIQIEDLEFEKMIEQHAIETQIISIGAQINKEYEDRLPVVIGVLNGSFMFLADLVKHVTIPCQIAFIKLSSYHGAVNSSRKITEDLELKVDIKNRDVILIEDIVDTGNTLRYIVDKLKTMNPSSIMACSLLYKPQAMEHVIPELKHIGFEIENKFVVGYGLDYKELGRNLKDIYQLVN